MTTTFSRRVVSRAGCPRLHGTTLGTRASCPRRGRDALAPLFLARQRSGACCENSQGRGQDALVPGRVFSARSYWFALALVLVALCPPPPAHAASALAELIAATQSSDEFDSRMVAAVYRETVLSGDGIDRAVARLKAFSRQPGLTPAAQANLHLAVAQLQWRDGEIDQAVASSDKALEIAPTASTLLLKARLLDTGGESKQARDWYRRAAEAFGEGDEQWLIQTRLAMMEVSGRSVAAVEELAGRRDQEFRNQAAVVLALLGRPQRAIALYEPRAEDGKLYRQHLRLAEWALQADEHELARKQAWLAYGEAAVRVDRLYALALLTESYRKAEELDALLEDLVQRDPGDQELLRLRVETLIETEEYGKAIELYKQLEGGEADVSERRRLVSLYEAAGDTDAMVREYERMMEAEPDQVQWYDGLAAHHLNLADNDSALEVWSTLESRNRERAEILVEAAGLMLQMGFMDECVAMVERHMEAHGPDVGALLFLFGAWLDKGQDEKALDVLVRLEDYLPPDAAERRDLADAYERLSRPKDALRIFEAIRDSEGGLGYDEQMRLAWLYSVVDRKQDALDQWQEIWVGVESPARRSFAESQLMLLASELGSLGDIAVELEGMLIEGSAHRNHMNLLVRIYTEVGDKLSATEIINEYAGDLGEDEIGRQELLAQVFMLLEDYPAHDKALRRLYEIDAENRVDHIKSIIINLLTFDLATGSDERFEEINRWIGELRKFDAEAVSGEFEASIYSMAGFGDQAIESYRRALVEQPENSDNLLLLADVLKSNGRTDEAVAILQFFAEHALEDNEFVVAVDGIINMIGATTFFQQPDPEVVSRLDWTRRVILERIAGRANKFYLYELLSDIAHEKGDTEGSFLALENSLAEAGMRRPSILRELLTMATPNAGFSGFSTGSGDIERQLKHGRRLVGLRQQLPPEVYIDVGKSLLKKEDVPGAERAFEMIDDITGLIDINRTKAEIFEEEGFDQESREYYNRALNVNRDSLELLHKTGFLYEADGRDDVAFRRYLKAISVLLPRQSAVLAAGAPPVDPNSWQAITGRQTDTTVTREFREHYASLEQGLLLTWPKDGEESARAVAELKAMFEDELRSVLERAGGNLLPLARYARLDRAARLIRRVSFYLDNRDLSQYADLSLVEHFAADEAFAEHLNKQYGDAGRALPVEVEPLVAAARPDANAGASASALRRQLALAESRNDFETQLQLLRMAEATEELEALLGERILDGHYLDGLGYALAMLSDEEFKRLAAAAAPKLMEDRSALLTLLGSSAEMYLRAEEVAGRSLVPEEEIVALLMSPEAWQQTGSPLADTSGFWQYLVARATVDDRIRYLQALAERSGGDQMFFRINPVASFHALLKERLNARQRQGVVDAATTFLSKLETNNESVFYQLVGMVLVADALPDNAGALYRIAEYVTDRWPAIPDMKPLLEALYEERLDEAFEQLIEARDGLPPQIARSFSFGEAGLSEALKGPRERLLDQVASGRSVDPKLARAAYDMEYGLFRVPLAGERLERKTILLDSLRKLDPEDEGYRHELIEAWLQLGHAGRAGEAIAAEFQAAPGDESWRLALFLFLKSQQRFDEALALAKEGGQDLQDAKLLQEAVTAVTRRGFGQPLARLISSLNSAASAAMAPGGVAAQAGATGLMALQAPGLAARRQGPVERLREALKAGDHEAGRVALRETWRGLLTRRQSPYAPAPGSTPLQWIARSLLNMPLQGRPQGASAIMAYGPVMMLMPATRSTVGTSAAGEAPQEPRLLFDAVAEAPYGATELGSYLRAMPDETRKGFHQLYEYLAKAYGADSERDEYMRESWRRLESQQIDDHEFTLWMLLRDELKVEFGPVALEVFERRVAGMTDPAPYQLLLAARVFATAGAFEQALEHYRLAAARRIQHKEFVDRRQAFSPFGFTFPAVSDLSTLIDEVVARLPREAASKFVDSVLTIARPAAEVPGIEAIFDAFLLSSLDKIYPPDELLRQAKRRSAGVLELPDPLVGTGSAKAAELVRAYARSGDLRRAMEILGDILINDAPEVGSPFLPRTQSDYAAQAMLQQFSQLCGIPFFGNPYGQFGNGVSGARELFARQSRLFPKGAEDWPGAAEWTGAVSEAALVWLEEGGLDPDQAVQLLVAVGMRPAIPEEGTQNPAQETTQKGDLLQRLLTAIEAGEQPLGADGLLMLAPLAQAAGSPIPFQWVADLLEKGGLKRQQQLGLLGLYAGSEDAHKVLALFRDSGLDQGLEVTRQLLAFAEESGDVSYAEDLRQRVEREEAAKKALLPVGAEPQQTAALVTP